MDTFVTCPRGHRWLAVTLGAGVAADQRERCPICGEAAEPADPPPPQANTLPAGPDAPPPAPPEVGRFRILGELGRGGMGVVYRAWDEGLGRDVAIKTLLPGAGEAEAARFVAEAQAFGMLEHPGILPIHEIGHLGDGRPFFSMKFVEGGSLADRLDGAWPADRAAALVEAVARAVQHAHERGVVHRDLKPSNLLMDESGRVWVGDFGLAKRLDAPTRLTASGAVLGTPEYMAPEQAAGQKEIGPAADIYALGVILYELLTGRPPFRDETLLALLRRIESEEPAPPSRLRPGLPRDLETVCLTCLRKDPAKRYASAAALADDLRRFREGEPILARPPRTVERVRGWMKRREILVRVSTGVLAAALASVLLRGCILPLLKTGRPPHDDPAGSGKNEGVAPVDRPALPPDLALVPPDAFGFVSVRVGDLLESERLRQLRPALAHGAESSWTTRLVAEPERDLGFGLRPVDVERLTWVTYDPGASSNSTVLIVATKRPYDRPRLREALAAGGGVTESTVQGMTYLERGRYDTGLLLVDDRVFMILLRHGINPDFHVRGDDRRWAEPLPTVLNRLPRGDAPGPLGGALALAAAGRYHVVAAAYPSEVRMRQWTDTLAGFLGREMSELWIVTLTGDLAPPRPDDDRDEFALDLRLTFPDGERMARRSEEAVSFLAAFRSALESSGGRLNIGRALMPGMKSALAQALPRYDQVRDSLGESDGNTLRFRLPLRQKLGATLAQDLAALQDNLDGMTSANRLRRLVLAMHESHVKHNSFPPAMTVDKNDRPLLSWRVELLPFLGEEKLYQEFRRDEPWDGENNLKLLARMPEVYAPPRTVPGWQPGYTFYQVFTGPPKEAPFGGGRKPRLADMQDGTSNTFLIVEGGAAVPWTKPADLPYSAKGPLPKLGGVFRDGFHAAFGDGQARFIPRDTPEPRLRAYVTPAGDEEIRE